jgi:DNA-binding HxlR family transcriptional regulator
VKKLVQQLNKAFESRVRLGIMSVLVVNDFVDYTELKAQLQLTDGNLASHLAALEKLQYILVRKQFVGKKPNTSYACSAAGRQAFASHLDALEQLIRASG